MTGALLVAAQFALIAAVAATGGPRTWSWPAMMLSGIGLAMGLATLWFNRPGNFRIRPEPKADGVLITTGPYRHVRHPMYTALLLVTAGLVWAGAGGAGPGCWMLLVVVLWFKSRFEERALAARFPDYAAYSARTGRFLPRLFR